MALQEQSVAEQLIEARERYVARGAGNPKLVVGGAHGAVIEDLNGREFLDFVGGIGCQNLGHGPEKVVAAVHAQVDRLLHQMSMVVSYEGYVDVCRLLPRARPAPAPRRACSSTAAPRRSRTRSRSRAPRPAGRPCWSSTGRSTDARCSR
jgi:4-aminobutyrate aminotransferase-like enzyme